MDHLDTLQRELDKVLEQVGRVLAATDGKHVAAAGAKLKHVLPGAQTNFHDALDSLSEELEFARLVMRRDLAVSLESKPVDLTAAKATTPAPAPTEVAAPSPAPVEPPAEQIEPTVETETDAKTLSPATHPNAQVVEDVPHGETQPSPKATPPASPTQEGVARTQNPQPPPLSQPDPDPDPTNAEDEQNDNIASLLPGLQDYANTNDDGGDADVDADNGDLDIEMFGTNEIGGGDEGGEGGGGGGGGDGMDFDFDFDAAFAAAGAGGDGEGFGDGAGGEAGDANGGGEGQGGDDFDFFKFD